MLRALSCGLAKQEMPGRARRRERKPRCLEKGAKSGKLGVRWRDGLWEGSRVLIWSFQKPPQALHPVTPFSISMGNQQQNLLLRLPFLAIQWTRLCIFFIHIFHDKESEKTETSLAVQWLRFRFPRARGAGSTPGQGTKIPHAVQRGQKQKVKKIKSKMYTFGNSSGLGLWREVVRLC